MKSRAIDSHVFYPKSIDLQIINERNLKNHKLTLLVSYKGSIVVGLILSSIDRDSLGINFCIKTLRELFKASTKESPILDALSKSHLHCLQWQFSC